MSPTMDNVKQYQLTDFLPTTKKEVELRGWEEVDIILFSGDAYVDHPSFGAAVIGRTMEAMGLKVAIVRRFKYCTQYAFAIVPLWHQF